MNLHQKLAAVTPSAILITGCIVQPPPSHREVPPTEFERQFTPEELAADLDTMIQVFEEVHPDLYHYSSREAIGARRAEIKNAITAPMDRVGFYPLAARMSAAFEDGHTTVGLPAEEWSDFLKNDGRIFPLDVEWRDEALVATALYMDDVPLQVGDRIESINGTTAETIYHWFLDEQAGGSAFETASFGRRIRSHLWVHGVRAPFIIELQPAGGGECSTAGVEGVSFEFLTERQKQTAQQRLPYLFQRLPEDIGYIEFNSMADGAAFDKFLKETFTDIQARPVRGLIVDLRKNGGGDSRLGDALLAYLTEKPYKMADRKEWKVSRRYKEYMKSHVAAWARWMPLQLFHPLGRRYFGTPEGQVAVFTTDMETPKPNPLRLRGPVCFLIGPFTFSSALMLANAVGDFDLATLIGQETGASPNAFGEVYSFDLPNTRLSAGVSSARFVRANGDADDPRGVLPNIEVRQSEVDLRQGVDTVLTQAQAWVLEPSQPPGHPDTEKTH